MTQVVFTAARIFLATRTLETAILLAGLIPIKMEVMATQYLPVMWMAALVVVAAVGISLSANQIAKGVEYA